VLALTATATPNVVEDIQQKLEFKKPAVFQKSFERKNLTYLVYKEEDKFGRLLKIASSLKSTGVVYVRNRRKTREIAEFLQRNGVSADYYHAGLEPKVRDQKQNAWMNGSRKVIVSTNAFGMGIDKPDVRFVVHMDLPDTLEAYFQEAGRAGRDEKAAWAIVLYEDADLAELRSFSENAYPPMETIRKVYSCLGNYFKLAIGSGKDQSFEFDLQLFSEHYKFSSLIAYNALRLLEREGYLWMSDALHTPSAVYMKMGKEDLYRFQVGNKKFDNFIKLLLRSYSGVFTGFSRINEQELGRRAAVKTEEVVKLLQQLHQLEVLSYAPGSDKPRITFVIERLDEKNVGFSAQVYSDRKIAAKERLEAVEKYVTSTARCRSQQLLAYFGEDHAPRCGECDVCKNRNKIGLTDVEFDRILEQIKPQLMENALSVMEVIMLVRGFPEKKVVDALNWLVDNDKVSVLKDGKYKWRKKK
jgi:ATP-dependent DNA helicase RecQ